MLTVEQSVIYDPSYQWKHQTSFGIFIVKGALSGLRQFLASESPLKVMKNGFYFTSKALFVLKISKFLA